jgi:hypothetical protein
MARHKGIPSRARVGVAGYFFDGWLIDHEIAEVWDGSAERWRLVELVIDENHADPPAGSARPGWCWFGRRSQAPRPVSRRGDGHRHQEDGVTVIASLTPSGAGPAGP